MTKIKPKVASVQDKSNRRDGRLQEKVLPKTKTRPDQSVELPNSPSKAISKTTRFTRDTLDRINQKATTERLNQAFISILGPTRLPSAKKNYAAISDSSKSMPAPRSPPEDRLTFRACISRVSRQIAFKRGCPKYSRVALRLEETNKNKPNAQDEGNHEMVEQIAIDANLKKLAEILRREAEEKRRSEELARLEEERRLEEMRKQRENKSVGDDRAKRAIDKEDADATVNFAPVFKVELADFEEESEREVDIEAEPRPLSVRDQRLARLVRDEAVRRQREELKRDEMKQLMAKTKDSIKEARRKFLEKEELKKRQAAEQHLLQQQRLGCCQNGAYQVHLCRHFQCLTQGVSDSGKELLRRERIASLYAGEDEVDELAETDQVEHEIVIEKSPQREGEIHNHIIGEEDPKTLSSSTKFREETLPDTSTKWSARDEIQKKMEATLYKMKNVFSEVAEPEEYDTDSIWRPSHPPVNQSTQSSKRVINLYSMNKGEAAEQSINIGSFIRASSRSANRERSSKQVHFADK